MKLKHNHLGFHLVVVPVVIVIAVVVGFVGWKIYDGRPDPQPLLTSNFVDIDKIDKISKFRSCQGHLVVPQDESESRRSMKHYVILKSEYAGGGKVDVYSPVDGTIDSISTGRGEHLEGEVWIGNKHNDWKFSVLHLIVASSLKEGDKVKAGQIIGKVADRGVDIVYGIGGGGEKVIDGYQSPYVALDSTFNHMNESLLAQYKTYGVQQSDMVYSKEFRDKNPCKLLEGGRGQLNDHEHPEDWVNLHR